VNVKDKANEFAEVDMLPIPLQEINMLFTCYIYSPPELYAYGQRFHNRRMWLEAGT